MDKLDRLGWAAGISFIAYGTHLGIRVNREDALDRLISHLPQRCELSSDPFVERLYSVVIGDNPSRKGQLRYNLVYAGATRVVRTLDLQDAIHQLESHIKWVVAANAKETLFVDARVVSWTKQAIVILSRADSGETSLINSLLNAGAGCYSDEFAVFDRQGQVWPYSNVSSLCDEQSLSRCPPRDFGGVVRSPLPVGLIVVSEYETDTRCQFDCLSPRLAFLSLLHNAIGTRSHPENALATLGELVTRAKAIKVKWGDPDVASCLLVEQLTGSVTTLSPATSQERRSC